MPDVRRIWYNRYMALLDPHGRNINYLRLSVTDRCNLRCRYCIPAEGVSKVRHTDILGYEELLQVAEAAVAIGVEKIRVTGGEPLVRRGIIDFLARLTQIPGLERLVLTTNGILLPEMARDLKAVGVQSLNISLDSLDPDTFARITRGGDVTRVLSGIAAVERAGFPYVKINMVVMRGVNDHEIADFAALTIDRPYRVRFIEYMPTAVDSGQSLTVPGAQLLASLASRYRLQPLEREALGGPATSFRIEGALGTVGVITPVSCHFCHECNRIRVTSSGIARSCLFTEETIDLKKVIARQNRLELQTALLAVVQAKPEKHNLCQSDAREHSSVQMSRIGG